MAFQIFQVDELSADLSSRRDFNSLYEIKTKTHPLSVISCSAVCHGGVEFTQAILKKNKRNHHFNKTILFGNYICFIDQMADCLCWFPSV